jgi:hypothetical protein
MKVLMLRVRDARVGTRGAIVATWVVNDDFKLEPLAVTKAAARGYAIDEKHASDPLRTEADLRKAVVDELDAWEGD